MLPVILTAPHDGHQTPPGVPERTGQGIPSGCLFTTTGDANTATITRGIVQRLLEICGEAPYVVIAEFHRKFIDANRQRECAYETPAAQLFYDGYHNTVRGFLDEIRAETGGLGLLFDIHGTDNEPDEIYLGTDDGKTIARLLKADPEALRRRRSLRGYLEAAGYRISEPSGELSGGYTVKTYGSANPDGLDAIQIEIAQPLRADPVKRETLIEVLAHAIASLVAQYADIHTSAAFRSINLLAGNTVEVVAGLLQRQPSSKDSKLGVGGKSRNRGRIEIRHDPAAPRRAGVLVLYDEKGANHYLWVDNGGKLRISPSDPGSDSQSGIVVGAGI
jgi:N-formylglutamate amidohydrolase